MIQVHSPVLLDLNTQHDLFAPLPTTHNYPVVNAAGLQEPLSQIFHWANRNLIPVVSTRLRNFLAPLPAGKAGNPKLICDIHSEGYQKLPATLLRQRIEMPIDCGTDLPSDGFKTYQQFIFDLPSLNLFECPRLDRLLSESHVGLWVLIGAPLEWTIRTAVLGLLQRRQKVALIKDAVGAWDTYDGEMALRQIESKNIQWFTTAEFLDKYAKIPSVRPSLLAQLRQPILPAAEDDAEESLPTTSTTVAAPIAPLKPTKPTPQLKPVTSKKAHPAKMTTKKPNRQYR